MGEGPCGTRIDRYDIEKLLGAGGMGSVYRARHAMLGQPVAIKLLRPELSRNPDILERFTREAQAAAAIGSPHIARATDFGLTPDGQAFMVMELLEGRDLDALLRASGPLPVPRVLEIATQMLAGLAAAHARGIVHRDLKPANVFLCGDVVKLLDFGVSKFRGGQQVSTLTRTGVIMGTPQFMAPEQFRGAKDVDQRADVYAAAVTVYQMLAGSLPFDATTYERLILQVCTEAPRPLAQAAPHVPLPVVAAIDKGMAREPDARWQTADEFAEALTRARNQVASAFTPELLHVPQMAPSALAATVPAAITPGAAGGPPSPVRPDGGSGATLPVRRRRMGPLVVAALGIAGVGALVAAIAASRSGRPAVATSTPDAMPPSDGAPEPGEPRRVQVDGDEPDAALESGRPSVKADAAPPAIASKANRARAPKRARGGAITWQEPRVVGQLTSAPLRAAFRQALPSLEDCRPAGSKTETVEVQFHVHTKITLAAAAPDNTGSEVVARCVAARVREQAPVWPDGTSGILFVVVTVPPAADR